MKDGGRRISSLDPEKSCDVRVVYLSGEVSCIPSGHE
jgi:hypothetical protein